MVAMTINNVSNLGHQICALGVGAKDDVIQLIPINIPRPTDVPTHGVGAIPYNSKP
jgi:hypothetical protein